MSDIHGQSEAERRLSLKSVAVTKYLETEHTSLSDKLSEHSYECKSNCKSKSHSKSIKYRWKNLVL